MIWLVPAALAGLILVAGPLALHLLTRHRARRVAFPTIRFVQPSNTAAVRPQNPTDVWLMCLRMAAIACAAAAAAQPLLLSGWRVASWNARIARAVVVDTSPSMQLPDAKARVPAAIASDIARAEQGSAYRSERIDTPDLNDGLSRAVRALEMSPPARREIVVVSDFHQGTVSHRSLADVPKNIGLRLVRAGALPTRRAWTGGAIAGWRRARWEPSVEIDSASTRVVWRSKGAAVDSRITVATAPGEENDGRAALRAATSMGDPESRESGAIVLQFAGAQVPAAFDRAHAIRSARNAHLADAIRANAVLEQAGRSGEVTSALNVADPWLVVTRDPQGRTLVAVAEHDEGLLVRTSARARSVFAPALMRALLLATGDAPIDREVAPIPDSELARWLRQPEGVTAQAWPHADESDARWFWVVALLMLLVESWVRGRGANRRREDVNAEAA